ncbi:hypothetical protein Pcinc_029552 [Petrolisthes cinctipes]|uniref:Cadherin domain-containing protein n=1 Tax=Petrolisthes cinctipes TaxID=88211 RepID=A0AAE1K5J6_PETCI|nr:hypothetical protein Pcinc_029552 [Petrolisthes cinctipes]
MSLKHWLVLSLQDGSVGWVADNNKHQPTFPECVSYDEIHVNENVTEGTPVLLVLAKDEDPGRSGTITYSLLRDFDSFAIHASNQHGQITTTRRLDRDGEDKEFRLTVIAKDNGLQPLQDTCSFRVLVEDVNDNPPIFDQERYDQTLATDHNPATPVLRVVATDRDIGSNGHVTFHLEGDPSYLEYFTLEPITGVLSLKKHLEQSMANIKKFEMRVRAVDGGTPPLWSTAPVTIKVVSSGELPPSVVKQHPRHPAIPENTTENTEVLVLCARSNLPEAPNVYFTLLNGKTRDANADGTFAIRRLPDQSVVCGDSAGVAFFVATRNLDYESVQVYKLNLQIVNDKNARLEQTVVVDIVDVNDNAPLLQPFDGAVLENTDGALITTIKAEDKDASPQFRMLTYSFDATASTDVMTKFALKPNGELWTTQPLDREEVNQYRVPIQVTDGIPEHTRMTTYWITVQDLNDVAPVFDRSLGVYEMMLPENREVGKPTGIRLVVNDTDIVNHFTFEIVEGNEEQKFRIDPSTRTLLVNKPLDFDFPTLDRNVSIG